MAIVRFALANPSANTDTLLFTVTRQSLVSILATNKSSIANSTVRVWVQPSGSSSPSQYAYMAYDTVLPTNNSLETFRFSAEVGDAIYVRASTADISFSINGIYDSTGASNITVSSTAPGGPTVGDVWVNSSTSNVYFWSGSIWQSTAPATAKYVPDAPSSPGIGDVWVDSDETVIVLNSNDFATKAYVDTATSSVGGLNPLFMVGL